MLEYEMLLLIGRVKTIPNQTMSAYLRGIVIIINNKNIFVESVRKKHILIISLQVGLDA